MLMKLDVVAVTELFDVAVKRFDAIKTFLRPVFVVIELVVSGVPMYLNLNALKFEPSILFNSCHYLLDFLLKVNRFMF